MAELNFCYQISEDAKMASTVDGENTKAYIKASLDTENTYTESEFKHIHDVLILQNIASQLGIDASLLTPISHEEYLREEDEDCK